MRVKDFERLELYNDLHFPKSTFVKIYRDENKRYIKTVAFLKAIERVKCPLCGISATRTNPKFMWNLLDSALKHKEDKIYLGVLWE